MRLNAVLAMDQGGVIGRGNQLPWHLPEDLKRFRRLTLGHPVVMGRKTHESIGRPLPGRRNIVVTRNVNYVAEGCEVVHSLEEALTLVKDAAEVMLIGGAALFSEALPHCDRLLLTVVDAHVEGDVTLPPFDWREWRPEHVEQVPADEKNPLPHRFLELRRVDAAGPEAPQEDWRRTSS